MSVTFDTSILLSYYQAKAGLVGQGVMASAGAATAPVKTPTAPWNAEQPTAQEASALVKGVMAGRKFVDESAAQLDVPGASADYRKLFALYQGLSTLNAVAERMNGKTLSDYEKGKISQVFARGLAEIQAYAKTADFEQLRLTQGEAVASAKAAMGVPRAKTEYITDPVTSSTTEPVPAYQGEVKFNISIKRVNTTFNVPIDLDGMGGQPRTIGNVVNFINGQLQAAGVETRFATQRIPGEPRKVEVKGGGTVTLPAGPDQWALKIKAGTSETITFSAPKTADAVYLAQTVGDADPDKKPATNDGVTPSQLLKFQTDTTDVPSPLQIAGQANWVDGRVFAETLGPEVTTVRATAMGADGSLYMLADIIDKTAKQEIKGEQDVALLRYDPAGKLIYSRTLGAGDNASGLALAIAPDGKIAIAGSVTGALSGATEGPMNSGATGSFATQTDSFVTLFNADGEELWTARRGARQADEASEIAFGPDGAVYVAGRAKSAMPGAGGHAGDWDGYIEAFKPTLDVNGKVVTKFTQSFGTAGSDRPAGMVVDGSDMYVATVEDGRGVLRRFDLSNGTPVLSATRDLGDLMGGDIVGLALDDGQLVVAGSTGNAALTGSTVSRDYASGTDAFAARLSTSLSADAADRIAFYGGAGDDRATALQVANGQVWLGGSTTSADLAGETPVGTKDGFLTKLDVGDGSVDWTRRFTGKDGQATPSAIAVAPGGASVLDRLGLPAGLLDLSDSQQVVAASSVRPGDQFTVRVGDGSAKTVTITAKDTLDTLAQNIRRASGFQAKVSLTTVSGVRQLKIEPMNSRAVIEINAGKIDKDALAMLGLSEGVIRATEFNDAGKAMPADGKGMFYGLSLASGLRLKDKADLSHVLAEVGQAMGVVRSAYRDLVAAAQPRSAQGAASPEITGPVPTYLTNQIANYQAALARLGGG